MLTIEDLAAFGADTKDGLARCLNNSGFYLKMIAMGLNDSHFDELGAALAEGSADKAFEAAHALKGILGNLSLTPLYTPISEITERLRNRSADSPAQCTELYQTVAALRASLCEKLD